MSLTPAIHAQAEKLQMKSDKWRCPSCRVRWRLGIPDEGLGLPQHQIDAVIARSSCGLCVDISILKHPDGQDIDLVGTKIFQLGRVTRSMLVENALGRLQVRYQDLQRVLCNEAIALAVEFETVDRFFAQQDPSSFYNTIELETVLDIERGLHLQRALIVHLPSGHPLYLRIGEALGNLLPRCFLGRGPGEIAPASNRARSIIGTVLSWLRSTKSDKRLPDRLGLDILLLSRVCSARPELSQMSSLLDDISLHLKTLGTPSRYASTRFAAGLIERCTAEMDRPILGPESATLGVATPDA